MKKKIVTSLIVMVFCLVLSSCSSGKENIDIVIDENAGEKVSLSAKTLQGYLSEIAPNSEFNIVEDNQHNSQIQLILLSNLADKEKTSLLSDFPEISLPKDAESYSLANKTEAGKKLAVICGYDERGLLYGVYDALEKLGYRFYLSEDFKPKPTESLSFDNLKGTNKPLFGERIVFNWHNFLSGITGWNLEEFKQWIDASVQMKYNTLMFHAYGSDPFMRYTFNDIPNETGLIPSTHEGRDWGITHVNDIRNLYGGNTFQEAVFGSKESKLSEDKMSEASVNLLQEGMKYASERSMDINFGFDIATIQSNPDAQLETLPKSAQLQNFGGKIFANPDTPEGYGFFKSQLEGLLIDYPQITGMVPWVRYMQYPHGGVYTAIKDMPEDWQNDYDEILKENPTFKRDQATNSFFYLGKILDAYRKALKELGRDDIKLGTGTWNWVSFPFMDKFISDDVSFYPIDWDMNFSTDKARAELAKIKEVRKVYPVVWAHHDDHSYIGRPFDPPVNMVDKLKERNAEGFGIIHWTTYPLDMYFKNLSNQVWETTINEPYTTTIKDYAENAIKSNSDQFNEYLQKFFLEAPHFGRETSDYFYDMHLNDYGKSIFPVYDPVSIIKSSKERLAILNKLSKDPIAKTEPYKYYKEMEEFFVLYFENQHLLEQASGICMNGGDLKTAAEIIKKANPEKVILKYAEAITHGPNTVGEQAIILRLNLNWLPDFVDIKQKTGLIPIEYSFYPTNHEAMAQNPGIYSYLFKKDKSFTLCLGQKETNGATILEGDDQSGILSLGNKKVDFALGYWRKVPQNYFSDTFKDNKLIKGKYVLKIPISSVSKSQIIIELKDDAGRILNRDHTQLIQKNREIEIPFQIGYSLLHISMKSPNENVDLKGLVIERIR